MRTEEEMFRQILDFARSDERIRLVGMEGSRTNPHVPKDIYRDYDISYLVTDMAPFLHSDGWLEQFGRRAMMQKPEAMSLFPPSLGNWFSYLILFEDGAKLDLKLIPVEELEEYLNWDGLLEILLDKDGRVSVLPRPTDRTHWIQKPTEACFDDCCNEFWFTSSYVAKGLCRGELLFASHMIEENVREQLFTMLSWMIGARKGYTFSLGKYHKFIRPYLAQAQWELLMETYRLDSLENGWAALYALFALFRQASGETASLLGFAYPDYDEKVTAYIEVLRRL